MRRLAQISLFAMFCCAFGALPPAARAQGGQQTPAAPQPGDLRYIREDLELAKLVGKPAPALNLKSIDGKSINLSDVYGKRPVYLKLWATYCIPCRFQMPGFKNIYASYGKDMTIIAVNAGVNDDIDKVKQFAQDFDLKMPVAIDDGRLGAWLALRATPVHLVIGRDGHIIFAGHQDGPALDAALKQALASKAAPVSTTHLAALVTLKEGDVIPPIALQSSDGKSITLPHGPSARPRAIFFTALWCEGYMKNTQPDEAAKCTQGREQVDKLSSGQMIEWFGVMSHMWSGPQGIGMYTYLLHPNFSFAMDTSGDAFRIFGVTRLPAVALIDTDGRLIKLVQGDTGQFAAAISSLQASQ